METDKLLRLRDVSMRVSMSKATIYRKIALGKFPKPVSVGGASVRWRASQINNWINALT
jgi:prophage regulatory protein